MRPGVRWAMGIGLALLGFGAVFALFYTAPLPLMPTEEGDRASVGIGAGSVVAAVVTAWSTWFATPRAETADTPVGTGRSEPALQAAPDDGAAAPAGPVVRMGDLPRRPVGFQPRDELVAELAASAADHRLAVVRTVTGTRGVGKTQLAAAYARRRIEDGWPVVAWINGETRGLLVSGLSELAAQLGVRDPGEDAETSARAALTWIGRAEEQCLLVIDNAVAPDEVAEWLPTAGRAEVVVTTTSRAFENLAPGGQVEVGVFSVGETLAFLRERTGLDDEEGARALGDELGRLPVALAQSAAVIKSEHIGYEGCLQRLRTMSVEQLLPAVPGERYPHRTAEVVLFSVQQAEAHDETGLARPLLDALALLSPSGVPGGLLRAVALRHGHDSGTAVERAVGRLVEASLANRMGADSIALHRLTRRVLRDRVRAAGALAETATVVGECLAEDLIALHEAWERKEEGGQLVGQVEALWSAVVPDLVGLPEPCITLLVDLRDWMARYLDMVGESARALEAAEETLLRSESRGEPRSAAVLQALRLLADIRHGNGRAEGAVSAFQRLLELTEETEGPDSPQVLTVRADLAEAHRSAGHFDVAVSMTERLVMDFERLAGPDHSHTLRARADLADVYAEAGRLTEAVAVSESLRERLMPGESVDPVRNAGELSRLADFYDSVGRASEGVDLLRRLLVERESGEGRDESETVWIRDRLADACLSAGLYDEALEVARQALDEAERLFGDAPAEIATVRATWAEALARQERYDEALREVRRAIDDLTAPNGPDHPDVLVARSRLVRTLHSASKYQQAYEEARQLLTDYERLLGTDSTATLRARRLYADVCADAGRHTEAVDLARRVLRDAERIHGEGHPWTLGRRIDLASELNGIRAHDEALALLRRTRSDIAHHLGRRHPLLFRLDEATAWVLLTANRNQEARDLRARVLRERIEQQGADAPSIPWLSAMVGQAELWLADYDSALARYQDALATVEQSHGPGHLHTIVMRRRLAAAYGSAQRVQEWLAATERTVEDFSRFYGDDHHWTLVARSEYADAVRRSGRRRQALHLRRALYPGYVRTLGPDHPYTVDLLRGLANDYRGVNRRIKALGVRRRILALEIARTGEDSSESLTAWRALGQASWSAGLVWRSAAVHRRVLERMLARFGPDHPEVLVQRWCVAGSLRATGRLRKALAAYRRVVVEHERIYGPDHVETLGARGGEAWALRLCGRVRKAVRAYTELVTDTARVHGADHIVTWQRRGLHAYAVLWSGHPGRALDLALRVHTDGVRVLGADHPDVRRLRRRLVLLALASGRLRTAWDVFGTRTPGHAAAAAGRPGPQGGGRDADRTRT
ncbi:tetratricopeptide repeat protein [Streptomyces sp. SS1-1]|uniref:tetratricopeptide repeat protein n=1 Tax=Streptomyces sp. SS1-1 TaxID=2651869 RepID=UPI0012505092|nr:tetratricopeptide repeat protein [Streptomyces sp. SS1-1]KAB2972642.1 tetratricopeptide repeat protein [Streptomyces sp. SS1-1]